MRGAENKGSNRVADEGPGVLFALGRGGFAVRRLWGSYAVYRDGVKVSADYNNSDRALERMDRLEDQARQTVRRCLCCGAGFVSEGVHNRMCTPCRTRPMAGDWMSEIVA